MRLTATLYLMTVVTIAAIGSAVAISTAGSLMVFAHISAPFKFAPRRMPTDSTQYV